MKAVLERLLLVVVSLLLLVSLEAGLRIVGFGSDDFGALDFGIPRNDDVYLSDPKHPGVMTVADWLFSMGRSAHRKLINPDSFPRKRPAGQLRIIAIGESAVFGYPTGGPMAFPYQLGDLIKERNPDLSPRVINAGIPGYDIRRVYKVLCEVLQYDPSVIIMYTGHNEYLRRFTMENLERLGGVTRIRLALYRLRSYQLLLRLLRPLVHLRNAGAVDVMGKTREMEKHEGFRQPRSKLETDLVVRRYRHYLGASVAATRNAHVPLILCTVISNVKAYPKHTVFDGDVTEAEKDEARTLRWRIKAATKKGDFKLMERLAREALRIVPGHAQYHHYLAQALEGQGKLGDAFAEYVKARETEATQRRGGTAFNEAIREYAGAKGVTVVDLEPVIYGDMKHGHFGEGLFSDYCHPTKEGHASIAEAIYRSMRWETIPR